MNTIQEIIEKYIYHYNNFEIENMIKLLTDNCIFENVSNSSGMIVCYGKEEFHKMALKSASIFSYRQQTVSNWVLSETKAAIEINYQARFAQDFNTFKAGDIIRLKGISIYEFENDKIKRLADFS